MYDGDALYYVSDELRNDDDVILAAKSSGRVGSSE